MSNAQLPMFSDFSMAMLHVVKRQVRKKRFRLASGDSPTTVLLFHLLLLDGRAGLEVVHHFDGALAAVGQDLEEQQSLPGVVRENDNICADGRGRGVVG